MNNSSRIRYLAVVAALLSASGVVTAFQTTPQERGSSFEPFIAHQVTKHMAPDGAPESGVESYHTYARRRDGSRVHMFRVTSPDGEAAQMVEILDYRKRTSVTLEPFTKSVITVHVSSEEIERKRGLESACASRHGVRTEEEPRQEFGVEATHVRDEFGNGFVFDRWIAPELGCLTLHETAEHRSGARNETKVTQLIRGEPPQELFRVPEDYTERSPFQVDLVYSKKYSGAVLFGERVLDTIERRYHAGRQPR